MKKILISAKDLKIGGIEKSLITLIKYLIEHGYKVTLMLEERSGELLKNISTDVEIIEYKPCSIIFMPIRKIVNLFKRLNFLLRYKNRFDISISYATYSKVCSFTARNASRKSILWCHADYLAVFEGNKEQVKEFFYSILYNKFSKIVFVAKSAKKSFLSVFPMQKNVYFCNNFIDNKDILKRSQEKIELNYDSKAVTFLNVGRHDENQKKLSRIIESANLLKEEGLKFRIIFVGDGKDSLKYKEMVKKYELEKYIFFIGKKENPYPYFKISDCVILSSNYEGYPVVFLESYILNKPIITTDVSDYEDIENGRGIVVKKSKKDIFEAMKYFLQNGYITKCYFDCKKYNKEIEEKLEKILAE